MSHITGPITVAGTAVDTDGTEYPFDFQVQEDDEELHAAIEQRWRKSFAQVDHEDPPTKET